MKTKHLLSLLLIILISFSCDKKQENYTFTGTIDNVTDGTKLYLKFLSARKTKELDTTLIQDGKFTFKGSVSEPSLYLLFVDGLRGAIPFIAENKDLNFIIYKDSLADSRISGSKENELAMVFVEHNKTVRKRSQKINEPYAEARRNNDTKTLDIITDKRKELDDYNKKFNVDFLNTNIDSAFGAFLLENSLTNKVISTKEASDLINKMSEETKNLAPIQRITKKLEAETASAVGSVAPNFSGPTPEGKELSLNDIKGKVTIIDFWAAWCGPCRKENPNVVNIYNKYHDKGLEIISVSLDGSPRQKDSKKAWIKAIEKDNLTWHHISHLSYFDDPIAKQYHIQSIPATIILDSEGVIVAKNLRGMTLENKISELLN